MSGTTVRAGFFGAVLIVSAGLHAAEIRVDPDRRFQQIEGWGASMVGWDLGNTPYNDPRWRNAYRDLGLNILRIPVTKDVLVHSSGDMTIPVSLGTDLSANVNRMNFNAGALPTWGGMASWLSQNALEPDRVRIVGSVWSAPHWMKGPTGASQSWVGDPQSRAFPTPWLSGQHNPWGPNYNGGDSIGGRLRTEDAANLQQYGRYLAAWMKGFEQRYGVPMSALSLQNESTFENPFDSMTYVVGPNGQTDYTQYAKGLAAVRDAWRQFGIETRIKGPHVAQVGPTPDSPWALLPQMRMIEGVKSHPDRTLIDFLDYYNANYYMGVNEAAVQATAGYYHGASRVPANWAHWTYAPGIAGDGKPVWYSETGGALGDWLNGPSGTPGNGAITDALKMFNALVHSNASAYIYWQMSDHSQGETEHNLLGRSRLNDPHQSRKYAAFKHFSRYVRPGAVRVDVAFGNGQASLGGRSAYDTFNSLNIAGFFHEQDETATFVLVNMRASAEPIVLDVPWEALIPNYEVYLTGNAGSFLRLSDLQVSGGALRFTMPGYSVMTLYGVAIPEPTAAAAVLGGAALLLRRRR